MQIKAKITGIGYTVIGTSELKIIEFEKFNINNVPASCILKNRKFNYGISKWVSPKRTRSYPFERVYNTLSTSKKITVIPIIKDEGVKGDRDYIQWDTVSLMSLLDVYVILAHYIKADKHPTRENKITSQKFDNKFVKQKIGEIKKYHSSALHWNLKEIEETLPNLIEKVKKSYRKISKLHNVKFHNEQGLNKFKKQFIDGVKKFMDTSRQKAKEAQNREQQTVQPKEVLSTLTKATITIINYLGGKYYFTTDEIKMQGNKLFLIEGKHSKNAKLPSLGDIKDGLLKMILYTNLEDVKVDDAQYQPMPILKLTSSKLKSNISSKSSTKELKYFFTLNGFSEREKEIIKSVFEEAKENNFMVTIENVK